MNMEELSESSSVENTASSVVCMKSKERPFSCTECGKSFPRKYNLIKHFRVHTQEKPYTCSMCEKSFKQNNDLVRHMWVHSKEKPFSCKLCDKSFNRRYYLRNHLNSHLGIKPYSCPLCDKFFADSGGVTKHMMVHTRERPFKCNECGQRFSQKYTLCQHLRTHTSEKPYTCTDCGKNFRLKSYLSNHMRLHSSERPYVCSVCEKTFRQKCILNRHMRVHAKEKPNSCRICGQNFSHSSKRNKHMKILHAECKAAGPQKNLDSHIFTSSGKDEVSVVGEFQKCSKNTEPLDAFKSVVESDGTSALCVQAPKHDSEFSSKLFSSNQEKEDAAAFIQKTEDEDEFFSIKEEEILPEDELDGKYEQVNALESVDDTKGRHKCKSLNHEPIKLDFLFVKMEDLSDNEGEEKGIQDPLGGL